MDDRGPRISLLTKPAQLDKKRFHLEWHLPLEPGLPTHAALFDLQTTFPELIAESEGGDEPETLLSLWTTLTERDGIGGRHRIRGRRLLPGALADSRSGQDRSTSSDPATSGVRPPERLACRPSTVPRPLWASRAADRDPRHPQPGFLKFLAALSRRRVLVSSSRPRERVGHVSSQPEVPGVDCPTHLRTALSRTDSSVWRSHPDICGTTMEQGQLNWIPPTSSGASPTTSSATSSSAASTRT